MPQTLRVRYTTDAASDTTPTWVDATDDVRAFSTSRGRADELARVETGTGSIVLNNRARRFDPTLDPLIRPMNRWWIEEMITGETVFYGYAVSYKMDWPSKRGVDAICTVALADEFMVLALDRLPTTNPPRDNYQDLVMFDAPDGYWPIDGNGQAVVGVELSEIQGAAATVIGLESLVGQELPTWMYLLDPGIVNGGLRTRPLSVGESGDVGGLDTFTAEGWFALDGLPTSTELLMNGPESNSTHTWEMVIETSGAVSVHAKNSGGTNHQVTSTTTLASSSIPNVTWYHVVGTLSGGTLRVYINGVEEDSTAFTGVFGPLDSGAYLQVMEGPTGVGDIRMLDEVSFFRAGLSADRIAAHYAAGASLGFSIEDTDERVVSVMAASNSIATVDSFEVSARTMLPAYMRGQPVLDELRRAETAESVDAILFVSKSGEVTFLGDGHRDWSPWNIEQALFDDDGTDLPYDDITVDYSDSFLANEWNVTRTGGTTSSASDSTSISVYGKRPQALTDLPVTTDADTDAIAAAMLAKYKDPEFRITGLTVNTGRQAVADAVLALELADRIRVLHTQPDGGRIVQTCFVQQIQVQGSPGVPWIIKLGLEAVPEVEVAADGSFRGLLALMG